MHLCKYCYANGNETTIKNNYRIHDDSSPLLIGHINPGDKIKLAKQESYKDKRVTLF